MCTISRIAYGTLTIDNRITLSVRKLAGKFIEILTTRVRLFFFSIALLYIASVLFCSICSGRHRHRVAVDASRAELKKRRAPPSVLAFTRSVACLSTYVFCAAIINDVEIACCGSTSGKCDSATRPAGVASVTRFKPFYRRGPCLCDANISRSGFAEPTIFPIARDRFGPDAEKSARFYGVLGELKILGVFAMLRAPEREYEINRIE